MLEFDFDPDATGVQFETMKVTITPQRAEDILTRFMFHLQRTKRPRDIKKYARSMSNGEWQSGGDIHVAVVEGKSYLINGQHRMSAIVLSGVTLTFNAVVYHCDDEKQAIRLYYVLDVPIVRGNAVAFDVTGIAEQVGVSKSMISKAASALRIIEGKFGSNPFALTTDETLDLLCQWKSEIALWSSTVGSSRTARHASVAPVMSVGLITFRHTPQKAIEFWRCVGRMTDLTEGTPEYLLAQFINGDEGVRQGVVKTGAPMYCRKVANAWNSYYAGISKKQQLRILDPSRPIVIAGSPYKG